MCNSRYSFVTFRALASWSVALFLLSVPGRCEAQQRADEFTINEEGDTYDSHPSAVALADGATFVTWHAYRDGRDRVLARRFDSRGAAGKLFTVSNDGKTHGPPVAVPVANGVWVIWSAYETNRWKLKARRFADGDWQPVVAVSSASSDAIYPAGGVTADGALVVAWSDRREGRFSIRACSLTGDGWSAEMVVSSREFDAYRPQIASLPGGATWIVWDEYRGTHYAVAGRAVLPRMQPQEDLSPPDEHCLQAIPLASHQGLYVAWLRKIDVVGGPRVISQSHTLHAAVRRSDGWVRVTDNRGEPIGAELTQGLMAKIAPRTVATGGYLGRRTHPMLIEVGRSVWLLWERKSDHKAATWRVNGDLVGRPIAAGQWGDAVILRRGLVDYHAIEHAVAKNGQFPMLASSLPRRERRVYHRFVCNVAKTERFEQDQWLGWSPVQLPVEHELPARRSIEVDGKTLHLFWADLHCHSGLTADAEGAPDELMHYASDRAQLDVVSFTNNDFLYDVPLTQYEYALSNFLAACYSREGFLAMPGYEWTSRVPGIPQARVSDPANWTPPYGNRSYPNHRSVIYPPQGGPLLHYPEIGNDVVALSDAVARAGGVTLTQHDAFLTTGHSVEVAMELTSGWRRYIARRPNLFHDPLNKGLRLGFVACGDTHRRAPGLSGALTGIYAEELTATAILDALRARRCFATSGSRIFIDARADETMMGDELKSSSGRVALSVRIVGVRPIQSATLIGDGRELVSFEGRGRRELSLSHTVEGLSPGKHWFYWRIAQSPATPDLPGNLNPAFGHLAWSSPHWVVVE